MAQATVHLIAQRIAVEDDKAVEGVQPSWGRYSPKITGGFRCVGKGYCRVQCAVSKIEAQE